MDIGISIPPPSPSRQFSLSFPDIKLMRGISPFLQMDTTQKKRVFPSITEGQQRPMDAK